MRKSKRCREDDLLMNTLQKSMQESGEAIKRLAQPQQHVTSTTAFANYVRDSLVSMSKPKFRKARSRINTILSDMMDEESDEDEPACVTVNVTAPAAVRARSATQRAPEMYQPSTSMLRPQTPASPMWEPQASDYMELYVQQPVRQQYQQQPQYQRMMTPSAVQKFLQTSPEIMSRDTGSPASVSGAVVSADLVLNQSSCVLDSSSHDRDVFWIPWMLHMPDVSDEHGNQSENWYMYSYMK